MWIFRDEVPSGCGRGRFCGLKIGVIERARVEALLGIRVGWKVERLRVEDQNKRVGGAADGLMSGQSLKPSVIT